MTEKRFSYNSFFIDNKLGDKEVKLYEIDNNFENDCDSSNLIYVYSTSESNIISLIEILNGLVDDNERLKKENIDLKVELDTHKHPLWSTREAERIVNELEKENDELKQSNNMLREELSTQSNREIGLEHDYGELQHRNSQLVEKYNELEQENEQLKKLSKTLIAEIEKKSIAFVIDEDIRRMLE